MCSWERGRERGREREREGLNTLATRLLNVFLGERERGREGRGIESTSH